MRKRLQQEDGIALVMALSITVVLIIFVASMISYTSSNSRAATKSSGDLMAKQYADAGLNAAYSMLVNQNVTAGGNPSAANFLGCNGVTGAADTNGPSDCSSPAMKVICVTTSGCALGDSGSASVYGFYSGTNPATYNSITYPAATWLLVANGYARNPQGTMTIKTTTATVAISALNSGAVAAVWNHMFLTSPLIPNTCAVDFGGNNMTITDPLYAIGNVCISGQNTTIQENAQGQPIDLMIGGKLSMNGSGTSAGLSAAHLTSGVVVGGCTLGAVTTATSACGAATNYYVNSVDTFIPQEAPEMLAADITSDYNNSDPGPKHPCQAGGLAASNFDNDAIQNGTNASFELVPNSSYTCASVAPGTGVLNWNNATKALTINGSVFFDGNVTIGQSALYTGTGVIEAAGTITINGNSTTFCAVALCNFNNWQGNSGNNSMITLVALKSNTIAIQFTNNSETFQGSMWCQPSSSMNFVKNGVTIEGPIAIGKFDASFNNAVFKPLPVIKNMPPGAPLPPNSGATVGAMIITK
jgi:Tfp pilus assembly protein PilX